MELSGIERRRRRLLRLIQILMIPICCGLGFATISSVVVLPRTLAQEKVKEPIPPDWEWVVPNHGTCYPWPFHGPITLLFLVLWVGSGAFLVLSATLGRDWKLEKLFPGPTAKAPISP